MGYLKDVISKVDYVLGSIKEIRTNGKKWRGGVTQYADLFWCMIRYGASPRNYYWFGFMNWMRATEKRLLRTDSARGCSM